MVVLDGDVGMLVRVDWRGHCGGILVNSPPRLQPAISFPGVDAKEIDADP